MAGTRQRRTDRDRRRIEDFGLIQLACGEDGPFGEFTSTYSLYFGKNVVEVYGSRGSAKVSYFDASAPDLLWQSVDDDAPHAEDFSDAPDRFAAEIAHFLDCVLNGAAPSVDAEDGLRANVIASAVYESIAAGRCIDIPG